MAALVAFGSLSLPGCALRCRFARPSRLRSLTSVRSSATAGAPGTRFCR